MSQLITVPAFPRYDAKKSGEENWNNLVRILTEFSGDLAHRSNLSFVQDGTEPFKVSPNTLPAGTVYFHGESRSDTINAYFDGANWRSWHSGRPSWRVISDMYADQTMIQRAAATTGVLAWVTVQTVYGSGIVSQPLQSSVCAYADTNHALAVGWTKAQFNKTLWDIQATEYSTTLYRFTAKQVGIYAVHAEAEMGAADALNILGVYKGGALKHFGGRFAGFTGTSQVSVTALIQVAVPASDYIEIFAYSNNGNTLDAGSDRSYVHIWKVA